MAIDTWNPAIYDTFKTERAQPFHDLLALLQPVPNPPVAVDLGCGTGELTRVLHDHVGARDTVGIDSSAAMLADANVHATAEPGHELCFEPGDLATFHRPGEVDVVFANASLHWVPDHAGVLARWAASLRPGGQLAVQVPSNAGHPSHTLITELMGEAPFAGASAGPVEPDPVAVNVLRPEEYALLLDALGFAEQHVRLQVYTHRLASAAAVADWTAGTTLTRVRKVLAPDLVAEFDARYRARLVAVLGDREPYLYPFQRVLFWGRLPS